MKAYNVLSGLAVLMLVAYLLIYLRMGSILKRNHPKLWEELGPPIILSTPKQFRRRGSTISRYKEELGLDSEYMSYGRVWKATYYLFWVFFVSSILTYACQH
jgi:hypothetical protein